MRDERLLALMDKWMEDSRSCAHPVREGAMLSCVADLLAAIRERTPVCYVGLEHPEIGVLTEADCPHCRDLAEWEDDDEIPAQHRLMTTKPEQSPPDYRELAAYRNLIRSARNVLKQNPRIPGAMALREAAKTATYYHNQRSEEKA